VKGWAPRARRLTLWVGSPAQKAKTLARRPAYSVKRDAEMRPKKRPRSEQGRRRK